MEGKSAPGAACHRRDLQTPGRASPAVHRIAVIGCGNMGRAIVKGLLESKWTDAKHVIVTHPDPEVAAGLGKALGVMATTDNGEAVRRSEIVLLGVKPQVIKAALKDVAKAVRKDQLVISIAAGISTRFIEFYTPDIPIVRSMPNVAVMVGEGATAIAGGSHAKAEHMELARQIFEAVGTVVDVPEHQMDAVTGLSGTGPMYVFHLLEAMADGGVKMGLGREVAKELAIQTILGSAKLANIFDLHPAALKDLVTSPGGTAITAHHILRRNAFDAIIMDAIEAATKRSAELGE